MRRFLAAAAGLAVAAGMTVAVILTNQAWATAAPPATTLGVWNGSPGSIPAGAKPNVLNNYYYWGNTDMSFLSQAQSEGATPFVELEPWQGGGTGDCQNGLFASIANNSSSAVSYENSVGASIKSFAHPVILTFAHEFNVSGQYPWAVGNSCGVTASQWITAWDHVFANIKAAAGGYASFMWAPNVDPNGNDTVAAQYWPGAANVDMVGVDGYPAFCGCGGTFADIFGGTFSEIQGLSGFSTIPQTKIFISETDLQPLDGSGYESVSGFISDLCSNGGDGVLQFQDGTPALSSTQWSELNTALASDCTSSSGGGSNAPVATTNAASGITASAATLNGSVNPEGASTTYQFEYGTTTAYGSFAPASPASAGSGTSAVSESAALSGLAAGTTYHYRIDAANAAGTAHGSDQAFTTTTSGACRILTDASSPARVELNNTTASAAATASFSPPAGSDVLVQVSIGFDAGQSTGPAVTVHDSQNTAFTAGPASWDGAGEGSYVFSHYYASAPGSITVTATRAGAQQPALFSVNTRVLTGAASSQSGAASVTGLGSGTTAEAKSITPTTVSSDVEAVTTEAGTPALTASGLTTDSSWYSANDGEATASGHVKTQALAPETVGWHAAGGTDWALAALEVLPATNC